MIKVKNKITGFEWVLDDTHAVDLIKKHPYDFEPINPNEEVKKQIEEQKVSTQEEKLFGIDQEIKNTDKAKRKNIGKAKE